MVGTVAAAADVVVAVLGDGDPIEVAVVAAKIVVAAELVAVEGGTVGRALGGTWWHSPWPNHVAMGQSSWRAPWKREVEGREEKSSSSSSAVSSVVTPKLLVCWARALLASAGV